MEPTQLLPLGEALRTAGLRLDVQRVRRACLAIDGESIRVQLPDGAELCAYTWDEVEAHSRAQRRLRRGGRGVWRRQDPKALTRWVVLLRLIGGLLEAQGVRTCVIEAAVAPPEAPTEIKVRVTADGCAVLDDHAVAFHRLRLLHCHIRPRESEPPPPRRRWPFWRRVS